MTEYVERAGLQVAAELAELVETRILPGTGVEAKAFWEGYAVMLKDLVPENLRLLDKRDSLQAQIDTWLAERKGQDWDAAAYRAFLEEIGYLVPEGPDFEIGTENVDPEIATIAGPQLVVPVMNARFALNAANARWGSLYDALYGTDTRGAGRCLGGGVPGRCRAAGWRVPCRCHRLSAGRRCAGREGRGQGLWLCRPFRFRGLHGGRRHRVLYAAA